MAQILYRATDAQGQPASGVIDADGVAHAREQLQARGLRDIRVMQEAAFGVDVKAIAASTGVDAQEVARMAMRFIDKPGLASVMAEVWRGARLPTLGFSLLAALALWRGMAGWAAAALAVAALPFALAAWSHRRARDYELFLSAHATGDWAAMQARADRLRSVANTNDALRFDLDLRCAYARIRQGEALETALAALEADRWRERLADRPGAYEAQVAVLYAAANRMTGIVQGMRAAVEASGGEPARVLDLALSEAAYGDVDEAQRLIDGVDTTLLPPYAAGFVAWTRGRIALRRHDAAAAGLLGEAVRELLVLSKLQPSVWISLALCTAEQAIALRDAGQAEAARAPLQAVAPILRAHAPRELLADLNDLLPGAAPTR